MLEAVPYIELEASDPKMGEGNFDLESAVRVLLEAGRGITDANTECEPDTTLDVCVDGQTYTVMIRTALAAGETLSSRLSPRELDIAGLIAQGLPIKIIALTLGLRPCTVSSYTKRIYLKLNVNSRAELAARLLTGYTTRFHPVGFDRNSL